jgi:cellulose biosynthesis protein BcsQ
MITITSFSYKGGAGRTVASANIAAALASEGKRGAVTEPLNFRVALIDLDVFSAGTHRVFEISNKDVKDHGPCIQDYLLRDLPPKTYIEEGGIRASDSLMEPFLGRGAQGVCRKDFTLFPATPNPDIRFTVQKYHENNLGTLLYHLEEDKFDYVIIDGESGTRQMADIAVRLADVVLMFFRLTWQHIEGSLAAMNSFLEKSDAPSFYLIPTCVPLVGEGDPIYQPDAPGLDVLRQMTDGIPQLSDLNEKAASHATRSDDEEQAYGHFWSQGMCIHDSLVLKGEERVVVYDPMAEEDRAARDYVAVASEISRLHPPR